MLMPNGPPPEEKQIEEILDSASSEDDDMHPGDLAPSPPGLFEPSIANSPLHGVTASLRAWYRFLGKNTLTFVLASRCKNFLH